MYVYLLKHSATNTFKIGKAIDIHSRIHEIGGYGSFDLDSSLCAQFPTERLALKHEAFIHHVFGEWNVAPDERKRLPGDTEHFKIECFDLVVNYLQSNSALFKCEIGQIPKRTDNPYQDDAFSKEARDTHRNLIKDQENNRIERNNRESANSWDSFIGRLGLHEDNIIQELPAEENGLTIILGLNRRQFDESGMANVGKCFFVCHSPFLSGCFGYGVIGCGGLITGHKIYLYLKPVSKDNMKIIRASGTPDLAAKIENINEWILNRRERASANLSEAISQSPILEGDPSISQTPILERDLP